MNTNRLVYWHNGLFLKPHHFQYLQASAVEAAKTACSTPGGFDWGVAGLAIDEARLEQNELAMDQAQLRFKDGTVVSYPDNALMATRTLDDRLKEESSLKCFVGLKKLDKSASNVTEIEDETGLAGIGTRFVCNRNRSVSVGNLYEENDPTDMLHIEYLLRIFFEDELDGLADYELLPLAVITNRGGKIALSDTYAPPTTNLFADRNLERVLKKSYNYLFSHVNRLEEFKTPFQQRNKQLSASKQLLALHALSGYIVRINAAMEMRAAHPRELFVMLKELAAGLSVFTDRVNVLGKTRDGTALIRAYDHENLYACFLEAERLVGKLLDDIIVGPDYVIPLAREEGAEFYHAELLPEITQNDQYDFFLAIKGEGVSQNSPRLDFMKVSDTATIETLIRRSLPGVPFAVEEIPPAGLPRKKETVYVKMDTKNELWYGVKSQRQIALFWDDTAASMEIKLIVVEK